MAEQNSDSGTRSHARKIAILLIATVAIVVAGGKIAADLRARSLLIGEISQITGLDVTISGPVTIHPGLRPGLRIRDIHIVPTSDDSAMGEFEAARLDLSFSIRGLLVGELEIRRIEISKGALRINSRSLATSPERDHASQPGLIDGFDDPDGVFRIDVQRLHLENVAVSWGSPPGSPSRSATISTLDMVMRKGRVNGNAAGVLAGLPFGLSAHYDSASDDEAGPLRVDGRIVGTDISLQGRFGGDLDAPTANLEFSLDTPDLSALGSAIGRSWPGVGPVSTTGRFILASEGARISALALEIQSGDEAGLKITADVDLHDISQVDRVDANWKVEAPDLGVIGGLVDLELPAIEPVELQGRLSGTANRLELSALDLLVGANRLTGSLTGQLSPDAPPKLTASLAIDALHLDDLLGTPARPRPNPASKMAGGQSAAKGSRKYDLSTAPLPWNDLNALNGSLTFEAGRIIDGGQSLAKGLHLKAELESGRLQVAPIHADWDGGALDGSFILDAHSGPPSIAVDMHGTKVQLAHLLARFDARKAWSGEIDFALDLETAGHTLAELTAGLSGHASALSHGGTVDASFAGLLTRDFFAKLRGKTKKHPKERLDCFAAELVLDQGVAEAHALIIDAADIVMVGKGSVDLSRDSWDMRVVPYPRDPSLISTAATIDITGPLAEPEIDPSEWSLVKNAGEAVLHNVEDFTGLSALWRAVKGTHRASPSCAAILGSSK